MDSKPTYIIAEIGVNHNGDFRQAIKLVDIAYQAGANAVKFQLFSSIHIAVENLPTTGYQKRNCSETSQKDLLEALELSKEEHLRLLEYCTQLGIDYLCTPFDQNSLSFLCDEMNLPTIKIASGELTNTPLLLETARKDKNIFLSTGMATIDEIQIALNALALGYSQDHHIIPNFELLKDPGLLTENIETVRSRVTLLHCTTDYPCAFHHANLRSMVSVREKFGLRIGFSDHTQGIQASLCAVALGATVIEKHLTLDRLQAGVDHIASIEAKDLFSLVREVRNVEVLLGSREKSLLECEQGNQKLVRKRIVANCDIQAGEQFVTENLSIKRSPEGFEPIMYWDLLGKKAPKNYSKNEGIVL